MNPSIPFRNGTGAILECLASNDKFFFLERSLHACHMVHFELFFFEDLHWLLISFSLHLTRCVVEQFCGPHNINKYTFHNIYANFFGFFCFPLSFFKARRSPAEETQNIAPMRGSPKDSRICTKKI